MAGKVKGPTDVHDEIVRLLAIQLRRSVGNQAETIIEMNRAGFGPSRIAELLGTTAGTVNMEISRAKKRKKPSGRKKTTKAPPSPAAAEDAG